ncbi:MAG: hypothetical protein ACOYOS_20690 [Syntrophales bacterium]
MVFDKYYDMWDRHGVKLNSKLEITKDILDQVNKQSEVCDLVWAINVANQSNKSPANLSYTVMNLIRKILPVLLKHRSCIKYSGADVEARAVRHFTTDPEDRFKKRQQKIRNVLETYIKTTTSTEKPSRNSQTNSSLLPENSDVDYAEMQLRKTSSDEVIGVDAVLDQIEDNFKIMGKPFKKNWREITKRNIEIWFGKAETTKGKLEM